MERLQKAEASETPTGYDYMTTRMYGPKMIGRLQSVLDTFDSVARTFYKKDFLHNEHFPSSPQITTFLAPLTFTTDLTEAGIETMTAVNSFSIEQCASCIKYGES